MLVYSIQALKNYTAVNLIFCDDKNHTHGLPRGNSITRRQNGSDRGISDRATTEFESCLIKY